MQMQIAVMFFFYVGVYVSILVLVISFKCPEGAVVQFDPKQQKHHVFSYNIAS